MEQGTLAQKRNFCKISEFLNCIKSKNYQIKVILSTTEFLMIFRLESQKIFSKTQLWIALDKHKIFGHFKFVI